jgi:hypothetical protein
MGFGLSRYSCLGSRLYFLDPKSFSGLSKLSCNDLVKFSGHTQGPRRQHGNGRQHQRWTGRPKAALVVEILQGRTTMAEASRSFEPLGFPGPFCRLVFDGPNV